MTSTSILKSVFGNTSKGDTPEERAASSSELFVRSQHQLSRYQEKAAGRILNAAEALRLFGWDKLKDLADNEATPVLEDKSEPFHSILAQLDRLGLPLPDVALKSGWTKADIENFQSKKQVRFRALERMAQEIDLDENKLGVTANAGADENLSIRLKQYRKNDPTKFTAFTVLSLTEAAWVIRKQIELAGLVGESPRTTLSQLGFEPSDDYGNALSPDYRKGYELALKTRELLGLTPTEPIQSLKDLIEKRLSIPVIQVNFTKEFAGATIATGPDRGIVINLSGDNANPLVRRMTMAHELGHLLWDPEQRLNKLRVDRYDDIQTNVQSGSALDHVERRANAFAVELLAPRNAILESFTKQGGGPNGLAHIIMTFGVSRTAIMYHLINASQNKIGTVEGSLPEVSSEEWEASESLATPLFRPKEVPLQRQGLFGRYVYEAHRKKLISDDTAASLFRCKPAEVADALETAKNLL